MTGAPPAAAVPKPPARGRPGTAESARGLLFTVLGEFVLPAGGAAWTSAFIDVFARLGVAEKAIRQALMRTGADGWLKPERAGRRTRWRLTPDAERLLTEGTHRIYSFTPVTRDWDGRWLLVLARVPETERPARHRLRTRLTWAGFGSPAPGVWISTHAGRAVEAEEILAGAGLLAEAQIFTARHQGGGDLATLVRQAWDLDALRRQYEAFVADFAGEEGASQEDAGQEDAGQEGGDPAGGDPLSRTVELVHSWRRFPWIDPALPASLLPAPWAGEEAARLFSRLHSQWSPGAASEWRRLNDSPHRWAVDSD